LASSAADFAASASTLMFLLRLLLDKAETVPFSFSLSETFLSFLQSLLSFLELTFDLQ
jgi:hypothetical protein